ncbi:GTP 3',8-cyclase MoaA [Tsukamurella sp. 8F]|uniref:GTP 3',8-cyclase MoaA n=1 Tax=unclassified Tsukamurella TaxID=2633480 RepID=UPI0023B8C260|nr:MULTISPECIES: GTP 3',8-cyclase MoaA [unclassified Tsukamurella]MDF0529832.1 GTP 3',8-cyclase MoaA [Tsukamurella sp. 8J]MDF0587024.1 GTP 3',8-cyclase MoaA [Tsukamurella sp. 8F]
MTARLVDRYGRVARDLRVSLTDRCNLRCTYCMPAEGLDWMASTHVLATDEVCRLVSLAVRDLGVEQVRFTGGEPLLRADLAAIVGHTAALDPRPSIALTTNGLSLARKAERLAGAGLDRVNVSLDTVDRTEYAAVTRRDRLDDALAGLQAAQAAGLTPVKVNAVLGPGRLGDAVPLLELCLEAGYELRIIEQMPLDAGHTWERDRMVTAGDVLEELGHRFTLAPADEARGSAPAQRYTVDGGPGTVGIIASVTRPFCGDCDRVRLTADGRIRTCLFAQEETDLLTPLRAGATDGELAGLWRAAMLGKQPGHGIDDPSFLQPARPMSAIGG